MAYKIISSPEAERDIEEVIKWYLRVDKLLVSRLFKELSETKEVVLKNPKAFQIRYKNIRIAFLNKFPYGVHYELQDDVITVISFFHTSRKSKNLDI